MRPRRRQQVQAVADRHRRDQERFCVFYKDRRYRSSKGRAEGACTVYVLPGSRAGDAAFPYPVRADMQRHSRSLPEDMLLPLAANN